MSENVKSLLIVAFVVVLYVVSHLLAKAAGLPIMPMPNPLPF